MKDGGYLNGYIIKGMVLVFLLLNTFCIVLKIFFIAVEERLLLGVGKHTHMQVVTKRKAEQTGDLGSRSQLLEG